MNDRNSITAEPVSQTEPLKNRLQQILNSENLEPYRALLSVIAAELGADILDCAAALVYLNQPEAVRLPVASREEQKAAIRVLSPLNLPPIKMVRYRLDIGRIHQVTAEEIKKVLVEESGVDKNNINRVDIHGLYTIIELPAGMPPDIFQHLKTVEINQQKLNITRVKARSGKKRGKSNFRRGRQRNPQSDSQSTDLSGVGC
ncbi:DbpA RNA binding domain-containing protein [Methylobacter sp. YRD-M1]|uniref:DbpA RNA binding domain-containing protein n=1 Tax=Methylobacter sp. YRD-M1 TaxID=2911520 RepID=UPI00227CE148|nr:DbpA RNA binding domain-containing protein [Methylobacter sp. YRD-M1]WAK03996.1 DbpA RNA binding domain-containing protein [Methylobacter sp. YRD-M1]